MIRAAVLIPVLFLLAACNSSEENEISKSHFEQLIKLEPPAENQRQENSKLYIDIVEQIHHEDKMALLIRGSFPDGCTRLKDAFHLIENHTIAITLRAWRNPDMICSQALTSFSFIYSDIPEEVLNEHSEVHINDKTYQIQ